MGIALQPAPTPATPDSNTPPQQEKDDPLLPILIDIQNTPFQLLRDRAPKLNIKEGTLQDMIKKLIEQGMIKAYKVHHGKQGAPRDLYEVTEKGAKLTNLPIKKLKGRGGYLHQFYQMKVKEFWKAKGWNVEIEGLCDSKNADLVASHRTNGDVIAIEIELNFDANPKHVIHNILKDLESGRVNKVVTLVPTKTILKKLKKLIRGTDELRDKLDHVELDCISNHCKDL